MLGAALTAAFVIAGLGAFYLLLGRHVEFARTSLRMGVVAGLVLCLLMIFPTGDRSAHNVAHHQPPAFAAMEGMFETQAGAPLVIIGNPNVEERRLESAIEMPKLLSFLTSRRWDERLTGLDGIPEDRWPDSVPLVYYAYHITYIANVAGWTPAETARQPWVVYGLLRTEDGASPAESVSSGTALFTLLGFAGLYVLLALLFVLLIARIIAGGPQDLELTTTSGAAAER
jgi:cytochrome d ubiquinol oxidase subunit I